MEQGYVDDFDLERIIRAIEEEFEVRPIDKPKVLVRRKGDDSDDSHVVNLDRLDCTCEDYIYNCERHENETGDPKYCKHIWHAVFVRAGLL